MGLSEDRPIVYVGCRKSRRLSHTSGDDSHGVDFFCVTATGQVVDGSIQTLQDGAVCIVAAQTLSDLVADVTGLDAW